MNTITKGDFLTMVRLNHLEVITQEQLQKSTQILSSYIEKSLISELSSEEVQGGNLIISDISTLKKWEVMRDDFSKAICYTRREQVEWEEPERGEFGEIIKAKGGIYKPTAENKKLGRVGQKYGESKSEEVKGKNEGGKFTLVGFGDGKLDAGQTDFFIRVKDKDGIIYRKPLDKEDKNRLHTLSLKDKQAMVDKYFGEKEDDEKSPSDLTDNEVNKIISEFFNEGSKLGKSIKNMPVNNKTEPILNKLHKRVREKGYLTEQGVFDLLTSDERKYLKKYSE